MEAVLREGLSGAGCSTGAAGTLPWQGALQAADAASFAGYTDWRLPNKNELESLVERRCYDPAINSDFFPNTPPTGFWSSSPYAYGPPGHAWLVNFGSGNVFGIYKYSADHVRLVRAGQ